MKVIPFNPPTPSQYAPPKDAGVFPGTYQAFHRHKEIEITLVLKGEGTFSTGNYSQAFKPGNVFIIGANQAHNFKYHSSFAQGVERKGHAIHLFFDFNRIPETFFLLQELSSIRKFISSCGTGLQLPKDHEAYAATLIEKVDAKTNLERLLGLLEIFHYFSTGIMGWKQLSNGPGTYAVSKSGGNRMSDVLKYTLDNYAGNITLNKIASIAHISPHAFCKYFKQHTSKTYNNFLNEVRVNEACKKIMSGSYDGFSVIAYNTGFKGASNFNRVFKKTMGMSPSDYRKEFRNRTA